MGSENVVFVRAFSVTLELNAALGTMDFLDGFVPAATITESLLTRINMRYKQYQKDFLK